MTFILKNAQTIKHALRNVNNQNNIKSINEEKHFFLKRSSCWHYNLLSKDTLYVTLDTLYATLTTPYSMACLHPCISSIAMFADVPKCLYIVSNISIREMENVSNLFSSNAFANCIYVTIEGEHFEWKLELVLLTFCLPFSWLLQLSYLCIKYAKT